MQDFESLHLHESILNSAINSFHPYASVKYVLSSMEEFESLYLNEVPCSQMYSLDNNPMPSPNIVPCQHTPLFSIMIIPTIATM